MDPDKPQNSILRSTKRKSDKRVRINSQPTDLEDLPEYTTAEEVGHTSQFVELLLFNLFIYEIFSQSLCYMFVLISVLYIYLEK